MMAPRRTLRLTTTALVTTLLVASGLPSLLATGPGNPEITDASGDVFPAAFFVNDPTHAAAFQNASSYDLVKVYVLAETTDQFLIEFRVRDLPEAWAVPPEFAPEEEQASPHQTTPAVHLAANFTVKGKTYEAVARLATPSGTGLVDSYFLRDAGDEIALSGSFDAEADTVTLTVPKHRVGSPAFGDFLTKFRAEGRFGETPLDFAPDTVDYEPDTSGGPAIVQIIVEKLAGRQVVEPRYGSNYAFGDYPGGVSGDILLVSDQTTGTVQAGESIVYFVKAKNRAPVSDTIFLTASSPREGVAHHLSETRLYLGAGSEQVVSFTVSTSRGVSGLSAATVDASSQLGDEGSLTFITDIKPASTGGATGGADGSGGGSGTGANGTDDGSTPGDGGEGGGDPKGGGSPGFTVAAIAAAAVLAGMWAARRRRA